MVGILGFAVLVSVATLLVIAAGSAALESSIDRTWHSAATRATLRIVEHRTKDPSAARFESNVSGGYRDGPRPHEAPARRVRLAFEPQRERPAHVRLMRDGRTIAARLLAANGEVVVRIEAEREGDEIVLIAYARPHAASPKQWERLQPKLDAVMSDLAFELTGVVPPIIPPTRVAPPPEPEPEPAPTSARHESSLDRRGWPKE